LGATGKNSGILTVGPRKFDYLIRIAFGAEAAPTLTTQRVSIGPAHAITCADIDGAVSVIGRKQIGDQPSQNVVFAGSRKTSLVAGA
jgi:hypothetical protein